MGINYVNYDRVIRCERCGELFTAHAPHTKYCDPCKPIAKKEMEYLYHARREEKRQKERNEITMQRYKGIEKAINECKENGMSYAERQKLRTLAMLPGIEI